jgi:uncharacterized membrane protein YfcA
MERIVSLPSPLLSGPIVQAAGVVAAVGAYAIAVPAMGFAGQGSLPLLAVFLAATTSSIAGFAFSAICGAMLFHLLATPVQIVQILLLCSIVNQSLAIAVLWRAVVWSRLVPFLVTGVVGAPIGVIVLMHSEPRVYLHAFGAILIAYGAWSLRGRAGGASRESRLGDFIAGLVGGFFAGFVAMPGAPLSVWLGMKGWDKVRQRAVYQPFILIMQILSLLAMRTLNGQPFRMDPEVLAYLPVSLIGTWCGLAVFRRLTDRQFAIALNALLIISGIGLLT